MEAKRIIIIDFFAAEVAPTLKLPMPMLQLFDQCIILP